MTVRKQSVAFDEDVLAEAKSVAADEGTSLSAWINRAARRELTIRRGLAAVAEWEAVHGAPTRLEIARADKVVDRVAGRGKRPRRAAR